MDKKTILKYPLLLGILLLAYAYNDIMTSGQAGVREADRSSVYYILITIVLLLFSYNVSHESYSLSHCRPLRTSTIAILCWSTLVGIYWKTSFTVLSTQLFLAFWWITTFRFSYTYMRNNIEHKQQVIFVYLVAFFAYLIGNMYARTQIIQNLEHEFAITYYVYYILIFIPFILLTETKWWRNIMLLLATYIILSSFKRGALVCFPIMVIVYMFFRAKQGHRNGFPFNLIFFAIFLYFSLQYVNEHSGGFLSERFSEQNLADGSGRTEYRKMALMVISQRQMLPLFIGTGPGSSVKLIGTGIHNEWVEFLFTYGIVGLLLYIYFLVSILHVCYHYVRLRTPYAPHMCMLASYVLTCGLFSGCYFMHSTFYFFSFMGIATALNDNNLDEVLYK